MHLGLTIPAFTWPDGPSRLGATFARIVDRAESAGFYSLWMMDHFFQIPLFGPPEHEMLESWTSLAFVAGRTQRLKLGVLVTGVASRQPGILVKVATTLDVLSQGRSYFGIGAGWNEEENRSLGVPFPTRAERFEQLEETLQIALQMWSGDERPFDGKQYHLARPLNSPQSVQRPHPPILIGGSGERKTLRLIARYADACNFFTAMGTDQLQRKLAVLREHCEAVGRPYDQIEKTAYSHQLQLTRDGRAGSLSPTAAIESFATLAQLGIDQVIVSLANVVEPEPFDLLATDIIPAVEQLPVAGR
jgi:F420-dependent oxidoreductase-like protein